MAAVALHVCLAACNVSWCVDHKPKCFQLLFEFCVANVPSMVAVWYNSSMLASINRVNLRRAWLVLEWVTVHWFTVNSVQHFLATDHR